MVPPLSLTVVSSPVVLTVDVPPVMAEGGHGDGM